MLNVQSIPRSSSALIFGRIAHPTDLSAASESGLAWAICLARDYQAELLLLHVLTPPTPIFEIESPGKFQAELGLSILLGKLEMAGIKTRGLLLSGTNSISSQIVSTARRERADLIIMGRRGRTGISRLLAGSLAPRVIARAHCPVLVVPSP